LTADITRWTSLALVGLVEVHGTARERVLRYTIDGEVQTASTAFGIRESDAAGFVVLAGSIVGQVAELVGRSNKSVNYEWVAGSRLQVGRIGALGVWEGEEICVRHFCLA
jgi:hypothetical protein